MCSIGRGGDSVLETRRERPAGAGGGGLSGLGPISRLIIPRPPFVAMGHVLSSSGSGGAPVTRPDGHPDGFCQEQDGGLMHSYWRLAVALLTIGELGAVVARWMVPSWNSASRRLNHLRLELAQVCGRGGLTRAAETHDSSSKRAMTRPSKSACQIWRRGCTPGCSGRGQPVCPCRIIPRPRPRPRRRPRCCRCPRASPGPAEKP